MNIVALFKVPQPGIPYFAIVAYLNSAPDKCVFGAQEVDFLGHKITANRILPLPSKVSVINNYPIPCTIKELQSFLGLVSYYHRFIPMAADKMADLHSTLW